MSISTVLHTALLVTDLEQSDYFYGTLLGLVQDTRDLTFPGRWYRMGAYQIHLIQSVHPCPPSPAAEQFSEPWGRQPHVAFGTTDLDTLRQRLGQAGFPVQVSSSGRAAFFVRDPDGNIIEVAAIPDPSADSEFKPSQTLNPS